MLPQCDTQLECYDGNLLAHSLIISLASPLLGDLIEVERKEQADKDGMHDGMISLKIRDSVSDVSLLLNCLSPSLDSANPRTQPNIENVTNLFHLADKYHMPGITSECIAFIQDRALTLLETTPSSRLRDFEINTILQYVAIGKRTGKDQLTSACLASIGRNFFAYQFQSWATFSDENSDDINIKDLDRSDLMEILLSIPRNSNPTIPTPAVINQHEYPFVPARAPQRIPVQLPSHTAQALVPNHVQRLF